MLHREFGWQGLGWSLGEQRIRFQLRKCCNRNTAQSKYLFLKIRKESISRGRYEGRHRAYGTMAQSTVYQVLMWLLRCSKTVEVHKALGEAFAVVEKRLNHFEEHSFTRLNSTPWVKFGSRLGAGEHDQIAPQVASVGLSSLDDGLAC